MKKRIVILMMLMVLLAVTTSFGIEKKGGGQVTPPPTEKGRITPDSNRSGKQKESPSKEKNTGKKDFDEFIDKNNNGIDDRIEQRKANESPGLPKDSSKVSSPKK